ncbi:MAG: ABC transporter ATP-binding protein [Abditibacteriota bacterium]|nr:ABC transporter ATP-binding protein [Abditibacteriota bacterium]
MLSLKNLTVGYKFPILSDVNLTVEKGEVVGILGPNGCGKTTLIRTLTRFIEPLSGEVALDGRDVFAMKPVEFASEFAAVSQTLVSSFDYTAREVVLMGRYCRQKTFASESERDIGAARKALRDVGMDYAEGTAVSKLSGGEFQRVMIARALAQETNVLLLDEPTSHLDINHAGDMARLFAQSGKAVLAVMHDINLATRWCRRIVLIKDGALFADGAPEEVITEENIKSVFDADCSVIPNPRGGICVVF